MLSLPTLPGGGESVVIFSCTPFYRPRRMGFATILFWSETFVTYTLEPYHVTVNSAGLRLTGCPTRVAVGYRSGTRRAGLLNLRLFVWV